jgi:hypothetical protein
MARPALARSGERQIQPGFVVVPVVCGCVLFCSAYRVLRVQMAGWIEPSSISG